MLLNTFAERWLTFTIHFCPCLVAAILISYLCDLFFIVIFIFTEILIFAYFFEYVLLLDEECEQFPNGKKKFSLRMLLSICLIFLQFPILWHMYFKSAFRIPRSRIERLTFWAKRSISDLLHGSECTSQFCHLGHDDPMVNSSSVLCSGFNSFLAEGGYHIETSPLICSADDGELWDNS